MFSICKYQQVLDTIFRVNEQKNLIVGAFKYVEKFVSKYKIYFFFNHLNYAINYRMQ